MVAGNFSKYINSPNYPSNYPHNSGCWWLIYSPTYVEIEIVDLNIEECCDHVKIYDGYDWDENVIEDLEYSHVSKRYSSTGQYFSVTFTSDGSQSRSGFSIRYWQTDEPGDGVGGDGGGVSIGGIVGAIVGVSVFVVVISIRAW